MWVYSNRLPETNVETGTGSFKTKNPPYFTKKAGEVASHVAEFNNLIRNFLKEFLHMPFVSITRLRLRSIFYLPSFMIHAMRSSKQVQNAKGFMKGKTLLDKHFTFWTMTLWKEEADMKSYRIADAHKKAMPKLLNWCDEASVVNWHQPGMGFPEWQHSYERMKKEGRVSKVLHPSPNHASMDVPPPRYPSRTERTLLPKQ